MKFSENLVKLRKEKNWSQEYLAEKLNVTRQTIYKWETGQSYPEMDRLIEISEIFKLSVDDLIKTGIKPEHINSKHEYDTFYTKYAKVIALGVFLIMIGVACMLLLFGIMGVKFFLPVAVLLLFVMSGVALFIYYGTQEEEFKKSIPEDANFYDAIEKRAFSKKMGLAMTIGVATIFIAIITFISLIEYANVAPLLALPILITLIAFAVATFVYFGMLDEKMKMEPKPKKNHPIVEKVCSLIMMLATVIFLLLGFLAFLWHIAWIAFPIGGILCGMVNIVFKKND